MAEPGKRYALVVGINRYQNDQMAKLSFAQQDARALGDLVEGLGFSVRRLLGRQATQAAVEAELQALASLPRAEVDLLLLFFSGHGDADANGRAYILLWDFDREAGSGRLNLDDLRERYIEGAQARQVYGIIDSCYAGQAAGEVSVLRPAQPIASDPNKPPQPVAASDPPAAPNGSTALAQQTAATFADLRGGRVVLAAVAGDQAAKEISTLSHSLLTYFLLKGWAEGAAVDSEGALDTELLYSYVIRAISTRYPQMPVPVQGGYLEGTITLPTLIPGGRSGVAQTLALLDAVTLGSIARRLRHLPNEERALVATAEALTDALHADANDGRLAALVGGVLAEEGADLLDFQWLLAARLLRPTLAYWPDCDAPGLADLITRVREHAQAQWARGGPLQERWAAAIISITSNTLGGQMVERLNNPNTPPAEKGMLLDLLTALGTGSGQGMVTATLVILSGGPPALFPAAARALVSLRPAGGEQAVTILAAHLSSPDAATRRAAAAAIAALETTETGPAVETLRGLVTAPDAARRADAVAALGQVAGPGASEQAAPLIANAIADADAGVRAAAARALAALVWTPGPATWEATLPGTAEVLKGTGRERANVVTRLLTALLADKEATVREAAVAGLVALGGPALTAALPQLTPLLADAALRRNVIHALSLVQGAEAQKTAVDALTPLLNDPDPASAGWAAVALDRLGSAATAGARLIETLKSSDPTLAAAAAATLADDPAQKDAVLPVLSGLLANADATVAGAAAEALARPTFVAPLMAQYEATQDRQLLAPLAWLARRHNLRFLPGAQVVRADGTTVKAADYQG